MDTASDDILLDIMLKCDPISLKRLVQTDPRAWRVYDAYKELIWRKLIQRDLSPILNLLQIE